MLLVLRLALLLNRIGKVDGHIEEKNSSKYLVFDSARLQFTYENKKVLKKQHRTLG